MDYTELRKRSLKVFLGFLGLTALTAIVSVLSGDFGEFEFKVLATSFTISTASICSMSSAAFIETKRRTGIGLCGIFFTSVGALFLIAGLWIEIDSEEYWKFTVTMIVAAISFAHAFLLVLPKLDDGQKWIQPMSSVTIAILSLLIVMAVWGEIDSEGYYRFLAAVAIVLALQTLAIPILMKLKKGNAEQSRRLVLDLVVDDIYKDSDGKQYRLEEIDSK